MLKFEKNHYTIEEVTLCGETVRFRAFRDLVYVEKPVNVEFQKMNLFVPESYYEGTSINGYDLLSAPVFMPNTVGGRAGSESVFTGKTEYDFPRLTARLCRSISSDPRQSAEG